MTFAPDESIYLTDGASLRRVLLDGTVTTLAMDLGTRTSEDQPTLFGGTDTMIMGLAVDYNRNIYVADAGNRRLLKIASDGRVGVVYRLDPPYFPTGVFATRSGDVYVLEFSFTPPGTTDKPRVRKISSDGRNSVITPPAQVRTGVTVAPPSSPIRAHFSNVIEFVNARGRYIVLGIVGVLVTVATIVWRRRHGIQRA